MSSDAPVEAMTKAESASKRRFTGLAVFLAAWLTAGWFHQSRDWNVASRLMLVYALGDRGTVSIDGLQRQTGDLAFKDGHYFCDKAPGFSLLATPSYIAGKAIFGWPDHPTNHDGFAHWPADAWVTWFSSGLASALIALLLFKILTNFSIPQRAAALASILTIWASPMAVYATLAYGHLVASCLMLGAAAIVLTDKRISQKKSIFIGLLAGFAVLTELAQAPVAVAIGIAAMLGDFKISHAFQNAIGMIVGALPSALVLFVYNFIAFGSPLDMGYFHHTTQQFAKVHSADNPLGLGVPDFSRFMPLFWGEYRGLFFYAPWIILAPVGWGLMIRQKQWKMLWLTLAGFLVPLWVNLSYPEWTGGWSTGPRLLLPALPWLGLAAGYSLQIKIDRLIAIPAYVWGWCIAFLFVGVGGRISQNIIRPMRDAVIPLWTGGKLPPFWPGERFASAVPAELAEHFFQIQISDTRLWMFFYLISQIILLLIVIISSGPVRPVEKADTPQE